MDSGQTTDGTVIRMSRSQMTHDKNCSCKKVLYFYYTHSCVCVMQVSIWHWGRRSLTPTGKIVTLAVNSLQKCSRGRRLIFCLTIRLPHQKFHKSNPVVMLNLRKVIEILVTVLVAVGPNCILLDKLIAVLLFSLVFIHR